MAVAKKKDSKKVSASVKKAPAKKAVAKKKTDLGHAEHSKAADEKADVKKIRPIKVVFMGAGSAFFGGLFKDIMLAPGMDEGEMCLVEIDKKRLDLSEKIAHWIMDKLDRHGWKITKTMDRRKVLKGADYIVNCIEVNGEPCVRPDNDIPLKYGVNQCIGDTTGPGGVMKALRTVPTWMEVLKDVSELCPKAVVLSYTNPMSIMCLAAHRMFPQIKHYGLCHSVQGSSHQLAGYAGVPYDEMRWECGGINHLAWFTRLEHNGKDLYPVINKRIAKGETKLCDDPVRFDIMKHFGAFVTESSGHFSEYLPYYRKRQDLIDKHCGLRYLGQTSFYADNWPQWRINGDNYKREMLEGKHDDDWKPVRSWEYATHIIEAIEADRPFIAHLNVPNTGLIDNLPMDGIVEVACIVNKNGVFPTHFGALPAQMAAICDWNMRCYELAAQACIEKDLEKATLAMMLDPNTASVCSPGEIRKMAEELYKAEKAYLDPAFFAKKKK